MNKAEQATFIDVYINSVKSFLIEKIQKLPDNWDGFELRHWIAQKFDEENLLSKRNSKWQPSKQKRRKECENDIIINNL